MADPCLNCARIVALEDRICGYCAADARPPNVRFASRTAEADGLLKRQKKACAAVKRNGTAAELTRLVELAETSSLVINRKLRSLQMWIDSGDELYVNFYKLKEQGVKMTDDRFNRQRVSAENTISPNFYNQLVVGALTIDEEGMSYYGGWSVHIREDAVRMRASVFWENPFSFNKRNKIISGDDPPVGYRAPWQQRSRLAIAKLGHALQAGDDDTALARHFMGPDRKAEDCDFIEVHVHGDIHADAIEKIVPPKRMQKEERTEWTKLSRKLGRRGIVC